MRLTFVVFIAFLTIQLCEAQQVATSYLALGDSYTISESVAENDRWPNQLAAALSKGEYQIETTIVAKTGWRTDDLMDSLQHQDYNDRFDIVSLLIGVNNQYQGKLIEQYHTEFVQLLSKATDYTKGENSLVFVLSIPDYYYTPFGQENRSEQVSEELDKYNAFAQKTCDSLDIPFIDITDISREGVEQPHLVAQDGLHPSGDQYALWVKRILLKLEFDQF